MFVMECSCMTKQPAWSSGFHVQNLVCLMAWASLLERPFERTSIRATTKIKHLQTSVASTVQYPEGVKLYHLIFYECFCFFFHCVWCFCFFFRIKYFMPRWCGICRSIETNCLSILFMFKIFNWYTMSSHSTV